jgi:predicted nuclease with TOPRIM domain
MKELNIRVKQAHELSVKQQKEKQYELIGNIIPHSGHRLFKINKSTLDVSEAEYSHTSYYVGDENKKEVIVYEGYAYVSALNKNNALSKYKKGCNGTKDVIPEPIAIIPY